jgi:hypothetical protein
MQKYKNILDSIEYLTSFIQDLKYNYSELKTQYSGLFKSQDSIEYLDLETLNQIVKAKHSNNTNTIKENSKFSVFIQELLKFVFNKEVEILKKRFTIGGIRSKETLVIKFIKDEVTNEVK